MNNNINILTLFAACLLVACNDSPKIIGIKIYDHKGNFQALTDEWKDLGINTVFAGEELSANKEFRQVLRENEIPLFVICPVFYNPAALRADSSLYAITDNRRPAVDHWVRFVCPSRPHYRAQQAAHIADLVEEIDPDGVSLDFIRHFVFWEKVFPGTAPDSIRKSCFCDHCLTDFTQKTSIPLSDSLSGIEGAAKYLLDRYPEQWNTYRTTLITSMVDEIRAEVLRRKPGMKFNVHAVPWRDGDFGNANISVAGQDIGELGRRADFISPMCYTKLVKQDAPWISSVVADMNSKAIGQILPSIEVFGHGSEETSPAEFQDCVRAALEGPSLGIVFWSWPLFEKYPYRKAEVKGLLK